MRNNFHLIKYLCLVLFINSLVFAQPREDRISNNNQPIDINSKAQELGITPEQLSGILNSSAMDNSIGEGDPLPDAMQGKGFYGEALYDNFGFSVSSAGDMNGDGYDDIIVGAPYNDAMGSNAGRVYIYFGCNIIDNSPDVILTGVAASDNFGYSVATAGDVNGDGYVDIIVGAPYNDAMASNAGRAYIYFGGNIIDNSPDVILTAEAVIDGYFGWSVSGAGDLNGDGYNDVIVGAPGTDYGGIDTGTFYIFFGGNPMDNWIDLYRDGSAPGDKIGYSVQTAGDVNGDGYSDIIVGAPYNDGGGTDAGRVYIYFGSSIMNTFEDVVMSGAAASDNFGFSVSSSGDLNGDGFSDVIVGSPYNDGGGTDVGRAYVYFGSAIMNNTADVILTGSVAGDNFGYSVSTAGDVNGDGYTDLVVGAYKNDTFGADAGRAYIYFGGSPMDNAVDVILSGSFAYDYFGNSVSNAGDVNGDGYSDVIIGAYGNTLNRGSAYFFMNSLSGTDIPDEIFTGIAAADEFSYSVSTAGDVNGDGYSDLIVGAYKNDTGGTDAGRAYIYFGGSLINNGAYIILTGASTNDYFGYSVSSAGDVNGDGYNDVIVGAYLNDAGGTEAGRAYIFYGGTIMDNTADVILTGTAAGDYFGYSVSAAGDVNGDGYSDVIVGAVWNDAGGSSAGSAYIFFGGVSMDNLADVTLTGAAAYDNFGVSVSTAGEVNGDGYSDVIVGAYGHDLYGSERGFAYIYFGGSNMNNTADVIITYSASYDWFGYSVSTAGDVNGDGYDDVICGAPFNNDGGEDAGGAYIFFGGPGLYSYCEPDVIMNGVAAGDNFGYSVSTAGDVNGDGYDDVIIGAHNNDTYGTDVGRAYIYFGGLSMDNAADITIDGYVAGDNFGRSVSTAGDVNRDGYDDIIVGSPYNDAGGNNAGRAYLYLSSSLPIKPHIMFVKDVPNDQGGYLLLKFIRSGYDAVGINALSGYAIEMSEPPAGGSFNWIEIGTVLPLHYPSYTYLAHTLYDSSLSSNGTFYFRVTAVTNQNELLRSNIMSGHSIDNLSPLPPMNFYANLSGSNVHLGWKANTEPDLRDYYIYRSETPILDNTTIEFSREANPQSPESLTLLGVTTDTVFTDTSPLLGNAYYYISAYDVHDNGSPFSVDSIEAILSANIRVFLQGPYSSGSMSTTLNTNGAIPLNQPYNATPWNYNGGETVSSIPADVVDWVLLELRSDLTTQVARRAAFVKSDGSLVDLDGLSLVDFPSVAEGIYYLVIYHRNHLQIMTSNPIELSSSPTLYDLTTGAIQAYGTDPMKNLGGGVYGMYSGDTNNSGIVTAADKSLVNSFNLSAGYYNADTNFSGIVTAADKTNINSNNLKQEFVP